MPNIAMLETGLMRLVEDVWEDAEAMSLGDSHHSKEYYRGLILTLFREYMDKCPKPKPGYVERLPTQHGFQSGVRAQRELMMKHLGGKGE